MLKNKAFPILPCDLCGSQENLQRKQMAKMLDELELNRPGTKAIMFAALGNVVPSHLLDTKLWTGAEPREVGAEMTEAASPKPELLGPNRLVRRKLGLVQ